eukprot:SAG31_NODE_9229_length_1311_cov_51.776587_1_plen_114_part_00
MLNIRYYEANSFGVRTENIYLVRETAREDPSPPEAVQDDHEMFYEFHSFTVAPIQTKCVLPELLTPLQREWLNEYNARVRETLLAEYETATVARHAFLVLLLLLLLLLLLCVK